MTKEINVYRIDYEMKDSTWSVSIAAYSNEEAYKLLSDRVGNVRVTSTNHLGKVDILTESVIKDIVEAHTPKKKPVGRPPKKKRPDKPRKT